MPNVITHQDGRCKCYLFTKPNLSRHENLPCSAWSRRSSAPPTTPPVEPRKTDASAFPVTNVAGSAGRSAHPRSAWMESESKGGSQLAGRLDRETCRSTIVCATTRRLWLRRSLVPVALWVFVHGSRARRDDIVAAGDDSPCHADDALLRLLSREHQQFSIRDPARQVSRVGPNSGSPSSARRRRGA